MENQNTYTLPKLVKGKKPSMVPKGSTLEKEWAKNTWYVNYTHNGKQYRVKGELNRIKDHKEKIYQAEVLLESIKNDLKNGFNPEKPEGFLEVILDDHIKIEDAIDFYLEQLAGYARPKSVQSYRSKLLYLRLAFPNKAVASFTTEDIESYIIRKIKNPGKSIACIEGRFYETDKVVPWTYNTVRSAKGVFRAFFQWCIKKKYYQDKNPVVNIEQLKIRSEVETKPRNKPFTKQDNQLVMCYLDAHDRITAFFCRFIYYTCLRPGELAELKLKDIDMANGEIRVPLSITKNTKGSKVETIVIHSQLYKELEALNLNQYPSNYFICSNSETIVGKVSIGKHIPYKCLRKALVALGLDEKGYNLYSFKHFSNIQRYNNGWKILEIMKANRHSSIAMTEKYLKDINHDTDIKGLIVPEI
jgi:integrase